MGGHGIITVTECQPILTGNCNKLGREGKLFHEGDIFHEAYTR